MAGMDLHRLRRMRRLHKRAMGRVESVIAAAQQGAQTKEAVMRHRPAMLVLWWWLCAAAIAAPAAARPVDAPAAPAAPADPDRYLRIAEVPGRSIGREVAARTFAPPRPGLATVTLVGVAHIGTRELYAAVQRLLDDHDIVLYESVKPAGTGGAGGDDDEERALSTREALRFLASMLEAHLQAKSRYPESLEELGSFAAGIDPRMTGWVQIAATDGWGRPVAYRATGENSAYALESLGADRQPGGEGAAADVRLTAADAVPPLARGDDQLQAELARALGLEFQLEAIEYDRPHFRCSDMAVDEVERALRAKGVDFGPIQSTLAGSSLPARIVVFLLRLMRVADVFLDGMLADTAKIALIELSGDQELLELTLRQLGEGVESVIIDARDQVVIDDLKAILERERPGSVAIFYGAAHMPDMGRRLTEQLGYHPVAEQWLTAIDVDLTRSAITPQQISQMRATMRQQVRSALRQESD